MCCRLLEQGGDGHSARTGAADEFGQEASLSAVRFCDAVPAGDPTQLVDVQLVRSHGRGRARVQADDRRQDEAVPGVTARAQGSTCRRPYIIRSAGKRSSIQPLRFN